MPERCGYCGRFMATTDAEGWDIEPRCSQTPAHILSDPEHWSVYVEGYDIGNGDTYTGPWPADQLPRHELVRVLEAREHTNRPLNADDLLRIANRPGGVNDQLRAALDARDHQIRSEGENK